MAGKQRRESDQIWRRDADTGEFDYQPIWRNDKRGGGYAGDQSGKFGIGHKFDRRSSYGFIDVWRKLGFDRRPDQWVATVFRCWFPGGGIVDLRWRRIGG